MQSTKIDVYNIQHSPCEKARCDMHEAPQSSKATQYLSWWLNNAQVLCRGGAHREYSLKEQSRGGAVEASGVQQTAWGDGFVSRRGGERERGGESGEAAVL